MIGYVTLGTNDIQRAAAFYDELLALVGAGRFMETDTFGFAIWARDAEGESWRLPGLVMATGSGSRYERLDGSPEALSGDAVAYRVVELTFGGAGDATPWLEVGQASGGGRRRDRRTGRGSR